MYHDHDALAKKEEKEPAFLNEARELAEKIFNNFSDNERTDFVICFKETLRQLTEKKICQLREDAERAAKHAEFLRNEIDKI